MKNSIHHTIHFALFVTLVALSAMRLRAEEAGDEKSDDLAMQLVNPVAALISLPIQQNLDLGGGAEGEGFQYRISVQPVIPFFLNENWNLKSSYDWENCQWTVPLNLGVAQLLRIGGSPMQFQLGGRYYAETPENGPERGLRFRLTFLWPR